MAAFPLYGELLLDGYGEAPETAVIRTEMETGPAKQARVRSKVLVARNVTYRFTNAQYISWKAWHKNTVDYGALWFDWPNPLDGSTVQARIANGGIYNAVSSAATDNSLQWDVGFVMETYE